MTNQVNQRGFAAEADLDIDPVEIGTGAVADGENSAAVGVGAEAQENNTVAVGDGAAAFRNSLVSIGQRDLGLEDGRYIVYPADQGMQTLADMPIEDAPDGQEHGARIEAGGESIAVFEAKADGQGGVYDQLVFIPGDLSVTGDVTEVDNTVTGVVEVEDGAGTVQFLLDATSSPPVADFGGNRLDDLNRINPTGGELLVDGDVTISGEFTEGQTL